MSRLAAAMAIVSGAIVAGTATAATATLAVAAILDRRSARRDQPGTLADGEVVAHCAWCGVLTVHVVIDRGTLDDPRQERPVIHGRCTTCGYDIGPSVVSIWPTPAPRLTRRPRGGTR